MTPTERRLLKANREMQKRLAELERKQLSGRRRGKQSHDEDDDLDDLDEFDDEFEDDEDDFE